MKDPFIQMVAILTEKLKAQEEVIDDLNDTIDRHDQEQATLRERLDELQVRLGKSFDENDKLRQNMQNVDWYRDNYDKVCTELTALKRKHALKEADSFMAEVGYDLLKNGNPSTPEILGGKISCIKRVRDITGWGLKESKDYVEAYQKTLPALEEGLSGMQKADNYMVFTGLEMCKTMKIECIKKVRDITGLGLKEAKDYVEACVKNPPRKWLAYNLQELPSQTIGALIKEKLGELPRSS